MRTAKALPLASALFLSALGAMFAVPTTGCSTGADDSASASANATASSDLQTAKSIVSVLGGENGVCSQCHDVNAGSLRAWGTTMSKLDAACFAPTNLTAQQRVDCLRSTPGTATSPFTPKVLGLYASGATTAQFSDLFNQAFGATAGPTKFAAWTSAVSMPKGGDPISATDFAKIKTWVLAGMPQLDNAFGDAGTTSGDCTTNVTDELKAHIASMKTTGWGARLADQATAMFGCGDASGTGCLTDQPDATATYGATGVAQTLRQLNKQALSSHWWVRSSADGRYVGYGMNSSAKIVDLGKTATSAQRTIKVSADYDPFFVPSNDGFAFAGTSGGSIRLCRQSLLADVSTAAAPSIALTEPKCASVGSSVYMSIGTALDGVSYYMTYGTHENDDGGNSVTTPLPAAFDTSASTTFTPMVNDGQSYKAQTAVTLKHPGEGDMMLSPSTLLAATRFGDGTKPKGYRVHFIKTTTPASASAAPSITIPVGAEICVQGQKPGFSFDERFMVTHQYVDHTVADEASLPAGSSNIVMVDLLTGQYTRITTTKAGQFALYPHFRGDGWLYFIVRDMNANTEYVVASDAAIRAAN